MFIDDASTTVATDTKIETSWLCLRVPLREAIAMMSCVAIGLTLLSLAILDARGDLHAKQIHHRVRVAEVDVIRTGLSAEEALGLKPPPPTPVRVAALDAPWTPAPADALPWTPAPYASVRLPTEAARAAAAAPAPSAK